MAHQVSSEISRFLGYLHFDQLLSLDALHYTGAPVYVVRGHAPDALSKPVVFDPAFPTGSTQLRVPQFIDEQVPDALAPVSIPRAAPAAPLSPQALFPAQAVQPFNAPQSFIDTVLDLVAGTPGEPVDPTVSYTFGRDAGQLLAFLQENTLRDNDIVLDRLLDASALPLPEESRTALEYLTDLAIAELPYGLGPSFEASDGIHMERISDGDAVEIELPLGSSQSPDAFAVPPNGTFVNGTKVSSEGQSQPEQSAQLREVAESILREGGIGEDRQTANEPAPAPLDGAPLGPSGGPAQIVAAGANEAANVAALYDLGDAFGSRIILGDYHEKNVIAQINVLADAGAVLPSDAALIKSAMDESSSLRNEASFVTDPGLLFGNVTAGFPGASHWHVDYVHGDLFDITTLTQRNFLTDNDVSESTQTTAHYVATLGENDQINLMNIVELGKAYDLIIIGGDYFKYNAIFQFNVLLDGDAVHQFSEGDRSGKSEDGNTLSNDAAIVSSGGNVHIPLSANAAQLADAIANQATTLDHAWTIGLPGNGNDTFEVLYITGDYYTYNLLLQTNIVADIDSIDQIAGEGSPDELQQTASSGGNAIANAALLYDLSSQSSYQMLGGQAYEEVFLVQANIIIDDQAEGDDDRDEDDPDDNSALIGVLAALASENDNAAAIESPQGGNYASNGDVLGSLLH